MTWRDWFGSAIALTLGLGLASMLTLGLGLFPGLIAQLATLIVSLGA